MIKIEDIKIPQATVSDKEILLEDYGQIITFYDTHLIFESAGKWSVKDEDLEMMVQKEYFNRLMVEKVEWLAMELYLHAKSGNFVMQISNFRFTFVNEYDANKLWEKIINWKFNK